MITMNVPLRKIAGWMSHIPWHLVVPLAFLITMLLKFPHRAYFEFDTDEGINLMKALLVLRGHPLYREIWSDQPPLFTYLLAGWFRLFGLNVEAARLLVLLFASLLMSAGMLFLRKIWGVWHALAGAGLVALLPYFLPLSMATMIGLPSLAFAMMSLERLAEWHLHHRRAVLVVSAILLGLSVLTKLFTAFLAPVFLAGILLDAYRRTGTPRPWKHILIPVLEWSIWFVLLVFGALFLIAGPASLAQLLAPHLAAGQSSYLQAYSQIEPLGKQLASSLPILVLALLGAAWIALSRRWLSICPLIWALFASFLLSQYSLIWYHHLLVITLPAALVAAVAIGEMLAWPHRLLRHRPLRIAPVLLWILTLACAVWVFTNRLPLAREQFLPPEPEHPIHGEATRDEKLVARMADYAPLTHWVVTDLPMYAFRAGLPTPPELAVLSTKRLESGALTEEQIIDIVQTYQPEQILLGRFKFPTLEQTLQSDYVLIYNKSRNKLYIRSDLDR